MIGEYGGVINKVLLEYMQRTEFLNYITSVKLDFIIACTIFANESFDLVFIDGGHGGNACPRDMQAWHPKLKSGGILTGYDLEFKPIAFNAREFFGAIFSTYIPQNIWWQVES